MQIEKSRAPCSQMIKDFKRATTEDETIKHLSAGLCVTGRVACLQKPGIIHYHRLWWWRGGKELALSFFFFGCIYIHSPCFCKIVNCQILVFIHVAIPLSLFRGFWLVSSFGVLDPLLSVIQESGRPPKGQYLLQISVPVDLF